MNILFLNNCYYLRGGSERVLFEEMRLLREAGHRVAVYSRGNERNEPAEFAELFPPPLDTERLEFSLKSARGAVELIYSYAARRGLREAIRRFRPDIAHAHNIYGRLSLSVLDELKEAGVPVVMTLHDLKVLCPSYLMLNNGEVCERCKVNRFYNATLTRCHRGSLPASLVYALESWINHTFGKYDSVSRFIAPSRFLRDKCLEYGWDGKRIAYLPNFINSFPTQEQGPVGDYLLYFGRLSREKGVRTLLQAFQSLKRPIPLMIVGDGPERAALERSVNSAGLPVTFTGYLSGTRLTEALSGARGVVMPSECYENAPLSILEAFASGKPVIGGRIGGIPELIDEGVNGYLFQPGDAGALAETIERFLKLPGSAVAAMGDAARAKLEREFTAERHAGMLLEVYQDVRGHKDLHQS
jgi:glycosyltransferase involved in cell wall biosynthesis